VKRRARSAAAPSRRRPARVAVRARTTRAPAPRAPRAAGRNGTSPAFLTVEQAVAHIRAGRMIIVIDDAQR